MIAERTHTIDVLDIEKNTVTRWTGLTFEEAQAFAERLVLDGERGRSAFNIRPEVHGG